MRDQVDVSLTALFHDVPVPGGLAERLLDRLAADRDGAVDESAKASLPPKKAAFSGGISRRRLLIGGGMLTTAVGLLLTIWLWPHGDAPLSEQLVLDEAIRWFDMDANTSGALLSEKPAPADYPMSQMVVRLHGARWRPLKGFLGHRGVVYDLPGPAGSRAALFVIDRQVEGFDAAPAFIPFSTSGCCASTWQENGLLYVLVVQGDPTIYGGYLNLPRSPLA